jgi:hypothetical protein
MSKTKTLKSMTISELMSERSRHRTQIGHLILQRMLDDQHPREIDRIEAELLKRRRRVVRLDRRIAQLRDDEKVRAASQHFQPMPTFPA